MSEDSKSARAVKRFQHVIWERPLCDMPVPRRLLVEFIRIICRIAGDVWEGQLTLRAMSLVYTTLLSIIPLLAISFSVLKGFGVHREIEPFLITFLAPLGERADEIGARLVEFIDNTSVSVLGYAGFSLLIYAVVSLMQKVESAFNSVWHVSHGRTFTERITDYLTLIIVAPTLMFLATGIWASILGTDIMERFAGVLPLSWLINLVVRVFPVFLIIIAFSFIYVLVPNTKVHWRAAVVGGVIAGTLWNLGGVGFAIFVGTSGNYPAIYSSFATAIFFMIWLYLAWMILLIGASISFYVQNPTSASRSREPLTLSNRMREKLSLAIAVAVGKRFYSGERPHTITSLTSEVRLPVAAVQDVVRALETEGLVVRTGAEDVAFVPARSWDTLSVRELMERMRTYGEDGGLTPETVTDPSIEGVWSGFESTLSTSVDDVSLRDLSR